MYIVGIDPGPVVGIVRLQLAVQPGRPATLLGAEALQVTPGVLVPTLEMLSQGDLPVVAVERFVVGPRAVRVSTPAGSAAARDVATRASNWAFLRAVACHERSATEVKPWATDTRLTAAGLMAPTTGMRHARDAARHALFAAVKTYGLPDPLSTRTGTR
jgi:hypothetical protein